MAEQDATYYTTIAVAGEGLFKDKGSKFLAFAFFVEDEEAVKNRIQELRKSHPKARHFCYAFRINPKNIYERANDDGEPKHSAGTPILGQIMAHGVVNAAVVVVRYFGGTKLGVSGLINAYKTAADQALKHATTQKVVFKETLVLRVQYQELSDALLVINQFEAEIIKREMMYDVSLTLQLRESQLDAFLNAFTHFKSIKICPK